MADSGEEQGASTVRPRRSRSPKTSPGLTSTTAGRTAAGASSGLPTSSRHGSRHGAAAAASPVNSAGGHQKSGFAQSAPGPRRIYDPAATSSKATSAASLEPSDDAPGTTSLPAVTRQAPREEGSRPDPFGLFTPPDDSFVDSRVT